MPRTVTVTGVDDAVADGDAVYLIVTAPAVSDDPDYNGVNAPDVSVTNREAGVLLHLEKTDAPDPVQAGGILIYTLTFSNPGAATATGVVLTETYDPDTTFVSADPAPDAGTDNVWSLGDPAPGESGTVTVTVRVKSPLPDGTLLRNTAVLSSDQGSVRADQDTAVQSRPVLHVAKTDSADPVRAGETLSYTITYSNDASANETAANVVLTETYDADTTFVSADPAPDVGRDNVWSLGDLAPGESGTVTVTVRVKSPLPDGTLLVGAASLTSDQGSARAEETTTVHSAPGLEITAAVSADRIAAGGYLWCMIAYRNGDTANETATNAVITGTYDPNTTFVSAAPIPDAGTDNLWTLNEVPPGESGEIAVLVRVSPSLSDGTLLTQSFNLISDQGRAEATVVATVGRTDLLSVQIPLKAGWNLISLPLSPPDPLTERVLGPLGNSFTVVWGYSSRKWRMYDPEKPLFSDLTALYAGRGYWIHMTEAGTLILEGRKALRTVSLSEGWNLAGYNDTEPMPAADALESAASGLEAVWGFADGQWMKYDPAQPEAGDFTELTPGSGYWLRLRERKLWTLP